MVSRLLALGLMALGILFVLGLTLAAGGTVIGIILVALAAILFIKGGRRG